MKLFPQLQMTLISLYSGWIFGFMSMSLLFVAFLGEGLSA
jgi:hypothetical protein